MAAGIAQRLLAADRTSEAWEAINTIDVDRPGWIPFEWEQTRLDVLEALGRTEEARDFRWNCFERSLDGAHLRANGFSVIILPITTNGARTDPWRWIHPMVDLSIHPNRARSSSSQRSMAYTIITFGKPHEY